MTTATILALAVQASPAAEGTAGGLTTFSWSFMLISMGVVTLLTVYCFSRVIATKKHFDPDGTGPARPPIAGDVEPGEVS